MVASGATSVHSGTISGAVKDQDGQPVPSVFIDLYDLSGEYYDYTATAADGSFFFDFLPAGDYYAHTDSVGDFADEWYDQVPGASDDFFYDPLAAGATPIEVTSRGDTLDINFSLLPAAVASGYVTGTGGVSISNVYVDAYLPTGMRFRSALTDEQGYYRIDGLPEDSYAIRTDTQGAWKDEWHDGSDAFDELSPVDSGVSPIAFLSGIENSDIDFQLDTGGVIEGTVINSSGASVSELYIDLYRQDGVPLEFDRTGSAGQFRFGGLPAGSYYLGTAALGNYIDLWYDQAIMITPSDPAGDGAELIVLNENETLTGLDFLMEAGAEISGSVTGPDGAAVGGIFVDVYLENSFFDYTVTDASGNYTLSALPDQTYYVKVDTLGEFLDVWYENHLVWNISDPVGDGADPLVIENGISQSNIDFSLAPGGTISGIVTDDGGNPIPEIYIDLYDADGQRRFYTRTDTDGTYLIGGLPDSTYYLRCDSLGAWVDVWYDNRLILSFGDPVLDGAAPLVIQNKGNISDINLALQPGASISGAVNDSDGMPLAGCYVEVYYGDTFYDFAETDTNGLYNVSVLPSGTLYLQTDNRHELVNEWYQDVYIYNQGDPEADGATPVELSAGESVANINFELGLGADIEGTVLTLDGNPLEEIFIDVFDGQGRFYDVVQTDIDGHFVIEFLPPGTFFVATDSFDTLQDLWFDQIPRINVSDPIVDGAIPILAQDGIVVIGIDFILSPFQQVLPPSLEIVRDSEGIFFTWDAQAQVAYQVQRSDHFHKERVWANAPSGAQEIENSFKPAGEAGPRLYRDPAPLDGGAFYRVVIP
jgi:protocatechuate 3,4-dioxygenase beta subunit